MLPVSLFLSKKRHIFALFWLNAFLFFLFFLFIFIFKLFCDFLTFFDTFLCFLCFLWFFDTFLCFLCFLILFCIFWVFCDFFLIFWYFFMFFKKKEQKTIKKYQKIKKERLRDPSLASGRRPFVYMSVFMSLHLLEPGFGHFLTMFSACSVINCLYIFVYMSICLSFCLYI